MTGNQRILLMLSLLVVAALLNITLANWGTDLPQPPILTFRSEIGFGAASHTGLYAPTFLMHAPWLSLLGGVILPMFLLGGAVYALVRPGSAQ